MSEDNNWVLQIWNRIDCQQIGIIRKVAAIET